jgi:hypothetical protein
MVRLKIPSVSAMLTIELSLNSGAKDVKEALGSSIRIDWDAKKEEWNCSTLEGSGGGGRDV